MVFFCTHFFLFKGNFVNLKKASAIQIYIQVSLAVHMGYLPDKSKTGRTKFGNLGRNLG